MKDSKKLMIIGGVLLIGVTIFLLTVEAILRHYLGFYHAR